MEKLVDVSSVEPLHNKKGKVTGWKFSATYLVIVSSDGPSELRFHSTRMQQYTFRNMFGWGYKLACNRREKMLTRVKAK